MNVPVTLQRQSKYCQAIEASLATLGHATNGELHRELRRHYPAVSATTVHRASARLAERGLIGVAPSALDGSMQYDTNPVPHDHFQCSHCGVLKDADIKAAVAPILESSIGDCRISGRLTVTGLCKRCAKL